MTPADPETLALLARHGAAIARRVAELAPLDAPAASVVVLLVGSPLRGACDRGWRPLGEAEPDGSLVFTVEREAALEAACGGDVDATRGRFRAYFAATPRGQVVVVFAGATVTLARVAAEPKATAAS